MTRIEIINEIKPILEELNYPDAVSYLTQNDVNWLKENIKALEQEPCEDTISREDALQALCKAVHKNDDTIPCHNQRVSCLWDKTKVQDYAEEILKLPPVTPQPKIGRWTIKQYQVSIENKQVPTISGITFPTEPTACKIIYTYTHSVCKSEEYLNKYNYCPNCGAKMEVAE